MFIFNSWLIFRFFASCRGMDPMHKQCMSPHMASLLKWFLTIFNGAYKLTEIYLNLQLRIKAYLHVLKNGFSSMSDLGSSFCNYNKGKVYGSGQVGTN